MQIATQRIYDNYYLYNVEFDTSRYLDHQTCMLVPQCTSSKFLIPQTMSKEFQSLRADFGLFFNQVRTCICGSISRSNSLQELKTFLLDCYQDAKCQLSEAKTCEDVLHVVREKCSLNDIKGVEILVERFNIKEACTFIEEYKSRIDNFCQSFSEKLYLKTISDNIMSCDYTYEAADFLLDWNADDSTQQDIKAILSHSLEKLSKTFIQVTVRNINNEEKS